MDADTAKAQAWATIDRIESELIEISHAIHARPELCYEEHFAARTLSSALQRHRRHRCRNCAGSAGRTSGSADHARHTG